MLLREAESDVPETNVEVFRALESASVIDEDLADRMARAASFRNVLAHQYGTDIDDRDVYNVLQNELPAFREFLERIRKALD